MNPERILSSIIQREMTISRDDFFRLLPKALSDYKYEISGQTIQVTIMPGVLNIHLLPEETRKIGALELPVIHITFTFENILEEKAQKFFSKFDLAYQKGGG